LFIFPGFIVAALVEIDPEYGKKQTATLPKLTKRCPCAIPYGQTERRKNYTNPISSRYFIA
jgi:hypothetical protein